MSVERYLLKQGTRVSGSTRSEQEPEIERFDNDIHRDSIERHPAYAHISASRVSGSKLLFGSDFSHQHYVTIRVSACELHRNLANDWHHSGERLIEVALSEAQWATFVSAMNGMGTPCTLEWQQGPGPIPQISRKTDRRAQFRGEVAKRMAEADERLEALEQQIQSLKLSQKQRDDLAGKVESARAAYRAGVPFITDQFDEHMENTVEHAKVEVNAYAMNLLQRAGLKSLQGGVPESPVTIELPPAKGDER